jgi:hypothetical protein
MTNGQVFGELLRQLGLDLQKQWAPSKSSSGRRYHLRKLDPTSWNYAQLYIQHRQSLTQGFQPVEPLKADNPSGNYYSKTLWGGYQGQNHTTQEVEPLQHTNFLTVENGENRECPTDVKQPVSPSDSAQKYQAQIQQVLQKLSCTSQLEEVPSDPDDVRWIGEEWLPLLSTTPKDELVTGFLNTLESFGGTPTWVAIWQLVPPAVKDKLLQTLQSVTGESNLRSFIYAYS